MIHALIGGVVFLMPFLAKIYTIFIVLIGIGWMLKSKNKNNEALLISAYIVGVEVFLRMTGGNPIHELSKYLVILFLIFGMFYKGFSKNSYGSRPYTSKKSIYLCGWGISFNVPVCHLDRDFVPVSKFFKLRFYLVN